MIPTALSAHWLPAGDRPEESGGIAVVIDPGLPAERPYSLLRVAGGSTTLSLSPAQAASLHLRHGEHVEDGDLSRRVDGAGITLEDPVHVYYLASEDAARREVEAPGPGTRPLTSDDAAAFAALVADCPEEDLDEAYVELDHWLVLGTFLGDRLVSAGSLYPWDDTRIADLGVITLPEVRGRGFGRRTVRAMSAAALERGFEPQYRCQHDNAASVALARAAGFTLLGEWVVIAEDD